MGVDETFSFGGFRVLCGRRELWAEGRRVEIGARALEVLIVLLRAPGELVTKRELADEIWGGAAVEDNAIQAQVSTARRALGCGVAGARWVQTVPGRGYRFVGEIARQREPLDPDTLELYRRAQALYQNDRGPEIRLLEQVTERAPHFAPAWAALAWKRAYRGRFKDPEGFSDAERDHVDTLELQQLLQLLGLGRWRLDECDTVGLRHVRGHHVGSRCQQPACQSSSYPIQQLTGMCHLHSASRCRRRVTAPV